LSQNTNCLFYRHLAGCSRSPTGNAARRTCKGSRKCDNLRRLCQGYGAIDRALSQCCKKCYDRLDFAADRLRSLAILNERQGIDPHDMDLILSQYSVWLLGRLAVTQNRSEHGANIVNKPRFDPGTDPYATTAQIIGKKCAKPYREAGLSAQRHSSAITQTLAKHIPPAKIAVKQQNGVMTPESTLRREQP